VNELRVFLEGSECGVLSQSQSGDLGFRYLNSYPTDATPLSLSMPVSRTEFPKSKIRPYIQGFLPDSPEALVAIGRRFNVNSNNPFALLSKIGADVAGALEFVSEDPVSDESRYLVAGELEDLVSEKLLEYSASLPSFIGLYSLAGAQPKLALNLDQESGAWRTATREIPSTHILKPLSGQYGDLDLAELLTMETARALGLKVAELEYATIGTHRVLMVKRYDRTQGPQGLKRLHQEDLCQALSCPPSKKYQKLEGGPSIAQIGKLFQVVAPGLRDTLTRDFYRSLVFNILVRANDAHAKNYSLLLSGQSVTLAPLYDLISGAALNSGKESAMSVRGEYLFSKISDSMTIKEGERLLVEDAESIVLRMKSEMPAAVKAASEIAIDQIPSNLRPALKKMRDRLLQLSH
jgi:serine/threonine-protein kinase HipA